MGADLSHFPTSIDSDRLGYIHTAVVLQKKITFFSTLFSRLNCFEKKNNVCVHTKAPTLH